MALHKSKIINCKINKSPVVLKPSEPTFSKLKDFIILCIYDMIIRLDWQKQKAE